MKWHCKEFSDLTNEELYLILRLRQEVFVVEQNCAYLDCDNADQKSFHLFATREDKIMAYARLLPPELKFKEASIGRVIIAPSARGEGLGKLLTAESLKQIKNKFGDVPVRISAQAHLQKFYGAFGFEKAGEPYLEDNIPHVEMLRKA